MFLILCFADPKPGKAGDVGETGAEANVKSGSEVANDQRDSETADRGEVMVDGEGWLDDDTELAW